MYVEFDYLGFQERPVTILCNPDLTRLCSLDNSYNTKLSLKYNALSEYSFTLSKTLQDINGVNVTDPAYALLKSKRIVYIVNFGYYQIQDVTEDRDGEIPVKNVSCTSWESELISKQVTGFEGTSIKFYDGVDNTNTFLGRMLSGTNWEIGDIDASIIDGVTLYNIYRDFNVSSSNVYNVLMTSGESAYNCIITFDPFDRLVNAKLVDTATVNPNSVATDIFLSFDNLVKSTSLKEISEEITTAMEVFGGDGLDIRAVNPLGTDYIYNFSYYQTRDSSGKLLWMSEGLNTAINNWMAKIASNQTLYANLLTNLKNYNITLGTYQATLSIKNDELAALIEVQKVRVEQGLDLTQVNIDIAAKNAEITVVNGQIANMNNAISSTTTQIVGINNSLSLTNIVNFTLAQQAELNPLIIQNTYQNQNIILTDIMSPAEEQDQAQQLYDQAVNVLGRASVPRYEFSIDTVNFVALKEYLSFTSQLNLGNTVTIENEEGVYVVTALLEINLSFDNLTDFSLVFSNRLRLDNGSFIYSDIQNDNHNAATSVNFNSGSWNGVVAASSNFLNTTSILNTATNQLINNSNQEITISQHGIIGKKKLANGTYSGQEIWLTNNVLAFSNDGFQTSSLALGKLNLPGGGTGFGIVAGSIIGNLIAGNSLVISNSNNSFRVDGLGATLTNATLTVTSTTTPNSHVLLSPTAGIEVTDSAGNKVFYLDSNKNLVVAGAIYANSGIFSGQIFGLSGTIGTATSGLIIDSSGLKTLDSQFYLHGNGDMHWGALTISGNNAVFSGNVSAGSLTGRINGNTQIQTNSIPSVNIHDLNADLLVAGKIRGIDIWGSIISWGGSSADAPLVKMYGLLNPLTSKQDIALVQGQGGIELEYVDNTFTWQNGMGKMLLGLNTTKLFAQQIEIGDFGQSSTNIVLSGVLDLSNIYSLKSFGGRTGKTGNYNINTTIGVNTFTFANGILVSVT